LIKLYTQVSVIKEIADGLMRAKQIEILRVNEVNADANSLIYNLAFSPKIRIIELSNLNYIVNDTMVEAFYKLLKISGSIESLLLSNTTFCNKISKDFYEALGQNKTLKHLICDHKERINKLNPVKLFQSIAMNKYKNGSLTHVSLKAGARSLMSSEFRLFRDRLRT